MNNPTQQISKNFIHIPDCLKETVWVVPEGAHRATLNRVAYPNDQGHEAKRLVFELVDLADPGSIYLAAKNYRAEQSQELVQDLHRWLGRRLHELKDSSGDLDLEKLVGMPAKVRVSWRYSANYDNPYCVIVSIEPDNDSGGFARAREGRPQGESSVRHGI